MNDDEIRPAGEPTRASPSSLPPWQAGPPRRILVVDDDACSRQLNAEVLTHSGYRVDTVADGAAGWEALQARHYDLLITDNFMPKVTGLEMVKMLRRQGATMPVIMATGLIPKEELKRHPWLEIGAFLVKPYSVGDLLKTVQKFLGEKESAAE